MTWEEILEMQRKNQAGAQKNRALASQGAQESAQVAQEAAQKAAAQTQMIGQLAGTVAGAAIGGPMGAQLGGQLGGAAAGGDIDPTKLATGAVMGAASSGMANLLGDAASSASGITQGGAQDLLLEEQVGKEFGLADRMATGQYFKQGGEVKHYKGGGAAGTVNPQFTNNASLQPQQPPVSQYSVTSQQLPQQGGLTEALNRSRMSLQQQPIKPSLQQTIYQPVQEPVQDPMQQQFNKLLGGKGGGNG